MTAPASKTAIPGGNIHRRRRVAGQELGVPGILLLAVPQAADHLSLLGVVAAIERAAAAEVQPYLRDVQDTLLLVDEEVAAQRDLLGTVLEANMAVLSVEQAKISNRQDATMERLTILASIFLPLTFVTGSSARTPAGSSGTSPPLPRSSSTGSAAWWCRWPCCCGGSGAAGPARTQARPPRVTRSRARPKVRGSEPGWSGGSFWVAWVGAADVRWL
jgi:hypothetical protein